MQKIHKKSTKKVDGKPLILLAPILQNGQHTETIGIGAERVNPPILNQSPHFLFTSHFKQFFSIPQYAKFQRVHLPFNTAVLHVNQAPILLTLNVPVWLIVNA